MAEEKTEGPGAGVIAAIVAGVGVVVAGVAGLFFFRSKDEPAPEKPAPGQGAAEAGAGGVVQSGAEAAAESAAEAAAEAAAEGAAKPSGPPPNISGDPEGYNTKIFASPFPVRQAMAVLGYDVAYFDGDGKPIETAAPGPQVRNFSQDYNRVSSAVTAGKVSVPGDAVSKPTGVIAKPLDVPGETFLRALEIAYLNQQNKGIGWTGLVSEAKEAKLS